MKYLGGKCRYAKRIVSEINKFRKSDTVVIEPFCGSLWVTQHLLPNIASDNSECLISMYKALQNGWEPPENVTEEEYKRGKSLPKSDPLHAFYAFGCSWGGKYWGGFARNDKSRNYAKEAKNSLLNKMNLLKDSSSYFCVRDYKTYEGYINTIFYCDPPYRNTTQGYENKNFNSEEFWEWTKNVSEKGALVFVSEFDAPDFAKKVLTFERKLDVGNNIVEDNLYLIKN